MQVLHEGTVLITGAASGIGAATAALLAERGHSLLLLDRDGDGLGVLAEKLASQRVETVTADIAEPAALERAIDETRGRRPLLSGLVTCAGIEVVGPIGEISVDDWSRCLSVNLTGTYLALRAALPELTETRGSAVLVASDGGVAGAPDYTAYCASKHGVIGLMRAASLELAPRGLRVNAVAPGFVETPMAKRIFADDQAGMDAYARSLPMGRFARPDEVAKVVRHLLGPESTYTNGMIYMVDGAANTGYFEPAQVK